MSAAFDAVSDLTGDSAGSPPGFPAETFRANLYLHHADGRVEWYALLPASFDGGRSLVLGRAPDCAVWVDDDAASGRHARIFARGPELVLEDLGSTNGTYINGRSIQREALTHGATLVVGHTEIRFLYSLRDSPVVVAFAFDRGPLSHQRRITEAASATIGGRGCDVELPGELAARHLRIDAYTPARLYAVPLDGGHPVRLAGVALTGITPLEAGARLEIGAHRFAVTTVPSDEARAAAGAPARSDAALVEARLQGHDPRAYNQRTIMDLSPLGAMVAKVLAGEAPMPPSAVRPPARRAERPTLTDATEAGLVLARRTGQVPRIVPRAPRWTRWAIGALALLIALLIAALVPVPRTVALAGRLETGPPVTVSAPVRGRLMQRLAPIGGRIRAGAPLLHLADEAIEAEIDRLSTRIGELEVFARPGRVSTSAVARAEAALAEATAAADALDAALARGDARFDQARTARRLRAEAAGRLIASRARNADRRAGPDPRQAATEMGQLVQSRQEFDGRLRLTLVAPVTGQITTGPIEAHGATVAAGRPLYTIGPTDPLIARFDPLPPDAAALVDGALTDDAPADDALRDPTLARPTPGNPTPGNPGGRRRARLRVADRTLDALLMPAPDGRFTAQIPETGPTPLPLGAPVEAVVICPETNALGWLWTALTR